MGFEKYAVITILFVVVFSFTLARMPNYLYNSGTEYVNVIGDRFDYYLALRDNETSVTHQVSRGTSEEFLFQDDVRLSVEWLTWSNIQNNLKVFEYRNGGWRGDWQPKITRSDLVANYKYHQEEGSYYASIKVTNVFNRWTTLIIEDNNGTRNDIGASFDENLLNVTMTRYYVGDLQDDKRERFSSADIVFALYTFTLPNIYNEMSPEFGFLIGAIVWVPVAILTFGVVTRMLPF